MLLNWILVISIASPGGSIDLHSAIAKGQDEVVIAAIRKDRGLLTPKTKKSPSPLHLAAEYGRHKIIEVALDLGADPNLEDPRGRTPLNELLDSFDLPDGWKPSLELLLRNGADPNHIDRFANPPLLIMFRSGLYRNRVMAPAGLPGKDVKKLLAMVEIMAASGADLWLKTKKGVDLLDLSILWGFRPLVPYLVGRLPDSFRQRRLNDALIKTTILAKDQPAVMMTIRSEMAKVLLAAGAEKAAAEKGLVFAAHWDEPMMLELLVASGANLDGSRDGHGFSILERAFLQKREKNDPVISFLFSKGADIHHRDKQGETALHHAVKNGSFYWVKTLLDKGAVLDDDESRMPLLAVAMLNRNFDMVAYLYRKGANWDGRHYNGKPVTDDFLPNHVSSGTSMAVFLHGLIRWRAGDRGPMEKFAELVSDPKADPEARRRWALYLAEAAPRTMMSRYIALLEDEDEVLAKTAFAMLRRKARQYVGEGFPESKSQDRWKAWMATWRPKLPDQLDETVVRGKIGVVLGNSDIAKVLGDHGAEKAGVREGDKVAAVDGIPIRAFRRRNATIRWLLSGPMGSEVVLTMGREGERIDVPVERTLPIHD